tara:strand:+ start:424 stop:645 length:222 start_codon:yes stop_codon:yes gene_type:complete
MIELMIIGGMYVLGGLIVLGAAWGLGALVTWPFDLRAELARKHKELKRSYESEEKLRKFISNKGLENEYRRSL